MKKCCLTVIVFYSLTTATAQQPYSKDVNEQIVRVENNLSEGIVIDGKPYNLEERMQHYNVKGLSIAVVKDFKIVWAKGYGWADEKEKRHVTTATLFKPGSISKSLNAVGVLKLAQENKVDLYKDINEYLRSWKFPYDSLSKGKKITIANLLSHTGGVSVYGGFPGYNKKDKLPTIPEILDGAAPANTPPVRSMFEPGLRFEYSGGGTIISQLIITDVSRQPYPTFMYNNVLKPMGMVHSFYSEQPPARAKQKEVATGYSKDGVEVASRFNVYPEQAPMGLWTTPTELCNYLIETQLAYTAKSSKVLNQEMIRLHVTPYIDQSSAMGVFIGDRNGEKYFFHDAGNEGFRGLFYGSVDGGNGVAIFVNSDEGNIILELLNSVALVYDWKGFAKPEQITTVPVNETLISKYIGDYITAGEFSEIKKGKDGLYMWIGGVNSKMYFTSEKDFRNMEFPTGKSFIFNNANEVSGFTRTLNGGPLAPAQRITDIDTLQPKQGQFGTFGRHLLENKDYDKAIRFLSRGMSIEPTESSLLKNLAHAHLFNGNFTKAMELYQQYLKADQTGTALREDLKSDFEYFNKAGFDYTFIKRAKKKLVL
jgi:CubicO group peptidase (beta-lactamase class C family)